MMTKLNAIDRLVYMNNMAVLSEMGLKWNADKTVIVKK